MMHRDSGLSEIRLAPWALFLLRSGAAWVVGTVVFAICACGIVSAQGKPGGGGGTTGGGGSGRTSPGTTNTTHSTNPLPNSIPSPDTGFPSPTFLSGKVVIDDGTPMTDGAIIQSMCMGNIRNEGYTDSRGSFSIDLQSGTSGATVQDVEASSQSGQGMPGAYTRSGARPRDLRQCTLQAVLPGFTSQSIELASKVNDSGNADVGTLVLHRLAKVEGLTISATSAAAPGKAKKEFQKGREEASKGKFDSALQHLSKAVQIYPKYAVAWNDLGRVQLHKNDLANATTSFQHSIDADASYVSPYGGLADIALKAQQWKQLVELTDKLLALNPVNFPGYWFDNALGNYFLANFDTAEKSAQRGLNADPTHQVPRLEYLLGMILVKKRDYPGALTHVQNYLRLQPNPSDRDTVEKQIAELQKLTTTGQVK